MFTLLITGGIGSGKSEAARYFAHRGAYVVDADHVAADLLGVSSPLLSALTGGFGPGILTDQGELDRGELARVAFASDEATARLNCIVHPAVLAELDKLFAHLAAHSPPPAVVVLVVPLLAEVPETARFAEKVLAIEAPEQIRVERAVNRGLTYQDAWARMSRQAQDSERAALADRVVVNDGSLDAFFASLGEVWDEIVLSK